MPTFRAFRHLAPGLSGVLASLLIACTSEKLVFREPFNPPPDAANKFLGYFTSSDKQTTCGNCHVNHQADWALTAHASAYATLVASNDATTECYTCHTVSDRETRWPHPPAGTRSRIPCITMSSVRAAMDQDWTTSALPMRRSPPAILHWPVSGFSVPAAPRIRPASPRAARPAITRTAGPASGPTRSGPRRLTPNPSKRSLASSWQTTPRAPRVTRARRRLRHGV